MALFSQLFSVFFLATLISVPPNDKTIRERYGNFKDEMKRIL